MGPQDAGLVQGNEKHDSTATTITTIKFGSGLHNVEARPESVSDQSDAVSEGSGSVHEKPETVPDTAKQQAFVGADGKVHEVPAELIGPDGKMLPLNERTVAMLRGKYFTVRHVFLANCQHKLDMINQPKTNCDSCWFQFFNTHSTLVDTANEFHKQYGKARLIAMRGKKFFTMFCRFMSTVHHILEEQKALEAANGNNHQVGQLGDGAVCTEAGENTSIIRA